jgi:hypothetical protein
LHDSITNVVNPFVGDFPRDIGTSRNAHHANGSSIKDLIL